MREFITISMDHFNTVEEYLNKIRALVNELAASGSPLPDKLVMTRVLIALNADYEHLVHSVVRSMDRDESSYTVQSLFSTLMDESRVIESFRQVQNKRKLRQRQNKRKQR